MRGTHDSLLSKALRAVRIRYRLQILRRQRRAQLRVLLREGEEVGAQCPVCASRDSVEVTFLRPEGLIEKYLCRRCEHLYSDFLQTDPTLAREMFQLDVENAGQPAQVQLLREVVDRSGSATGAYLDFGVGGNISAFQEAQRRWPQHRFMGCDLYASDTRGYFGTYSAAAPLGEFDGIASYAVVEHLTHSLEAWQRLNRLLKPMARGGGIMVHAFPSQLHHDFEHWAIQIRTHSCLFSRRSLVLTCRNAGFAMEKTDPPRPVGPHDHPVLVFRKQRDV
jgi:hypothetical protein